MELRPLSVVSAGGMIDLRRNRLANLHRPMKVFRRQQCCRPLLRVVGRVIVALVVATTLGARAATAAEGLPPEEAAEIVTLGEVLLPAPSHELRRLPATEELPTPVESLAPVAPEAAPVVGEFSFCQFCGDPCGGGCCANCGNGSQWGRFASAIYRGLCCPDPCYQGKWRPKADAAFFTTAVRPQNQQRFRWDYAEDLTRPDRAEYFWARADGAGAGPTLLTGATTRGIDYDELRHYAEVAHGPVGISVEYSYRAIDQQTRHQAGFGDVTLGTKTLLFDTELVQFAFQFLTHVPAGAPNKGLGTGHVSLEPGIVMGVNVSPNSYLQAEVSEWIPLGGDADYAGALLRYNAAYNVVLMRPHPCVPVVGVVEVNGFRFQDGQYTDIVGGALVTLPAGGEHYVNLSGGLRTFFCDKADFGVAYSTPISDDGWTDAIIRSELRFRY